MAGVRLRVIRKGRRNLGGHARSLSTVICLPLREGRCVNLLTDRPPATAPGSWKVSRIGASIGCERDSVFPRGRRLAGATCAEVLLTDPAFRACSRGPPLATSSLIGRFAFNVVHAKITYR